jgi:glutamate-1-semialdehyde 2,1-aminomutase
VTARHDQDGSIPGGTSTGSKRRQALFGEREGPRRMVRSAGCRLWDEQGREFIDLGMALGAVALGYGHPAVSAAAERALRAGVVGTLPPVEEQALAERLLAWVPGAEAVRFLKTGAEAVAAAVRIARVVTGRDVVLTCGYHGWLDWAQAEPGVPVAVRALHRALRYNDGADLEQALQQHPRPCALVIEPVVEQAPDPAWLRAVRDGATRTGALLVFDEIKTGIRFGPGGAARRYGVLPDLVVLGKALGNGFPIAAVVGPRAVMQAATRTWISSTLATESVALAAGQAVLEACETTDAVSRIAAGGERLLAGLRYLADAYPQVVSGVGGVVEFSFLRFRDADVGARVAAGAAARGVLFRRMPYNFISLAHDDATIATALDRVGEAVGEVAATC